MQPLTPQTRLIKTPQGEAEIRTRSLGLRGSQRRLLIMANGEQDYASLNEIGRQIGADPLDLRSLIDGGFLAPAHPAAAAAAQAPEPAATSPETAAPAASRIRRSLPAAKMYLLDTGTRLVGSASEVLEAARKASSTDELLTALDRIGEVATARNAGELFASVRARVVEMLPAAA